MKKNFDYLPKEKRFELNSIVKIILENVALEKIILFGSYARGDWLEELAPDGIRFQYQSDYDLLVLVGKVKLAHNTELWDQLRSEIQPWIQTPLSIIRHTIDEFNRKINNAEYFFTDILKEGILLYDSNCKKLAQPRELSLSERRRKAVDDFEYWFESAQDFYQQYRFAFSNEKYKMAAFQLHQATEHCYAAILLVFTNYKPRTHDLSDLSGFANSQEPQFLQVFPQGSLEEKRWFELLRQAYVGARYLKEYQISREELEWLSQRVTYLHQQAEILCQKKIQSFVG